jgi:hypothetical protein
MFKLPISRAPIAVAGLFVLPVLTLAAAVTPVKAVPNTVNGRVVDERGRPVAGVKILVEAALFSGLITTTTDAQGRYQSVELSPAANPYTVSANKELRYHGQPYCLRMAGDPHPYHDAFNARSGVTRNFIWKIRGESDQPTGYGGDQTWGGTVRFETLSYGKGSLEDRSARVQITLVPEGPLIDGSAGKTITRTVRIEEGLDDIPVGYYRMTAALLGEGGAKTPLRLGTQGFEQGLPASTTLLFKGYASCGHSGTLVQTPVWLTR